MVQECLYTGGGGGIDLSNLIGVIGADRTGTYTIPSNTKAILVIVAYVSSSWRTVIDTSAHPAGGSIKKVGDTLTFNGGYTDAAYNSSTITVERTSQTGLSITASGTSQNFYIYLFG